MTERTVLIIEDDPTMLRGLEDTFRSKGYDTQTAGDGEGGLEAALNTYVETGKGPRIESSKANTLLNTLQRVKRSLLLSVWDEKWGDSQRFSQWVQQGALSPPPAGLENAAAMFIAPL